MLGGERISYSTKVAVPREALRVVGSVTPYHLRITVYHSLSYCDRLVVKNIKRPECPEFHPNDPNRAILRLVQNLMHRARDPRRAGQA